MKKLFLIFCVLGCIVSTRTIYDEKNRIVGYIRTNQDCTQTIYDRDWCIKSHIRDTNTGTVFYNRNWKREGQIRK